MRTPISFEKVTNKEQLDVLRSFAASFSHTADETTLNPIWVLRRGNKIFGYVAIPILPIIFPAFKSDATTPREFADAVEQIRAKCWMDTSGHEKFPRGFCMIALDHHPSIGRDVLRKIGFEDTGCSLWKSIP